MMRYKELGQLIKVVVDYQNVGVYGQSHYCEIAKGKYELKNKLKFNTLKWSLHICSISLTCYIVYKILF